MTNSLVSTLSAAGFLAVALCATPLVGQDAAQPEVSAAAPAAETTTTAVTAQPAAATAVSAAASPGIRIVRLSQVTGEVQMDRQTGNGFEAAFANLPIVQGSRLRTGEGVAEVEFEDNSSLRLTPHSLVEFPVLSADPERCPHVDDPCGRRRGLCQPDEEQGQPRPCHVWEGNAGAEPLVAHRACAE